MFRNKKEYTMQVNKDLDFILESEFKKLELEIRKNSLAKGFSEDAINREIQTIKLESKVALIEEYKKKLKEVIQKRSAKNQQQDSAHQSTSAPIPSKPKTNLTRL